MAAKGKDTAAGMDRPPVKARVLAPVRAPSQGPRPAAHTATYGAPPQGYPAQPGTYGQPPQFGTYGSPAGPGPGASAPPPMGQGGYQPQSYPPPGAETARGARDSKVTPTGGWPYVEQRPAPKRKRGLVIALIVAGALIVLGGAAAVTFLLVGGQSPYEVGACVKQQGSGAEIVECSSEGAYRIASIVDSEDKCPDPAKPVLVLTGGGAGREVACLTEAT